MYKKNKEEMTKIKRQEDKEEKEKEEEEKKEQQNNPNVYQPIDIKL